MRERASALFRHGSGESASVGLQESEIAALIGAEDFLGI
jgi:hypothetical protein